MSYPTSVQHFYVTMTAIMCMVNLLQASAGAPIFYKSSNFMAQTQYNPYSADENNNNFNNNGAFDNELYDDGSATNVYNEYTGYGGAVVNPGLNAIESSHDRAAAEAAARRQREDNVFGRRGGRPAGEAEGFGQHDRIEHREGMMRHGEFHGGGEMGGHGMGGHGGRR